MNISDETNDQTHGGILAAGRYPAYFSRYSFGDSPTIFLNS